MGYLHINNLYKDQEILMFKECYALEKIHGTSAHVSWIASEKKVKFFAGGEGYEKFVSLFDLKFLQKKFAENFPDRNVKIHGEAYGGKQQGMRATYGNELKFIAFDVKVINFWLDVPKAEIICNFLNIEFVPYRKIETDLISIDFERDRDSIVALRNGCGNFKIREGVVLRPLIELTKNDGSRIIAKHKRAEFTETRTPREVTPEQLKILQDAKAIAEEWVTEMRLKHVLDKLPKDLKIENVKLVIDAMIEDIYREGKGEIVESREAEKFIGGKTASMFKRNLRLDRRLL
jgi:hypothetical protein